ncbi:hypothetical protein ACPR111641_14155 [Acinetobacter pragensis]|uniref:Uncharacterized protein n=1 Tax=Acinetobacter pragensis TaxID=1806892 RepID=A0A151Y2Z0_9GAMM|nr:hypothetical protein AZH43_10450 [Acinetobacter pragensis]
MLKLSNFFLNTGLFILLIFISLCWALDNIEIWVRYVLIPALAACTGLGVLFKYLAKKFKQAENPSFVKYKKD